MKRTDSGRDKEMDCNVGPQEWMISRRQVRKLEIIKSEGFYTGKQNGKS